LRRRYRTLFIDCGGKGNATKEKVAVGVYKRWGQEFTTNDEADAFVLAKIGQAYLCGTDGLTAFQKEVIENLSEGRGRP